jgi:hypothetical protein
VAGTGERDHTGTDGALDVCTFREPIALCRWGGSLIVADRDNYTIRLVEGVLGVTDLLTDSKLAGAEFEAHAVPLIMTAIPVLPTELARLMAQYAQLLSGTRTIAGLPGKSGRVDGSALSGALFRAPASVALDTTDPVAGPQLMIGEDHAVRCLNLRTEMVATIAGDGSTGRSDGPASRAILLGVRHRCRSQRRSVCNGSTELLCAPHQRCEAVGFRCDGLGPGRTCGDDADRRGRC